MNNRNTIIKNIFMRNLHKSHSSNWSRMFEIVKNELFIFISQRVSVKNFQSLGFHLYVRRTSRPFKKTEYATSNTQKNFFSLDVYFLKSFSFLMKFVSVVGIYKTLKITAIKIDLYSKFINKIF
jgi:hypothetical protein